MVVPLGSGGDERGGTRGRGSMRWSCHDRRLFNGVAGVRPWRQGLLASGGGCRCGRCVSSRRSLRGRASDGGRLRCSSGRAVSFRFGVVDRRTCRAGGDACGWVDERASSSSVDAMPERRRGSSNGEKRGESRQNEVTSGSEAKRKTDKARRRTERDEWEKKGGTE